MPRKKRLTVRRTPRRAHSGRNDQRRAAVRRKADAWALLRKGGAEHTGGAVYLGGYAVECKIKAVAMERFVCWTLEELAFRWKVTEDAVFSHGLDAFLRRLGLTDKSKAAEAWPDYRDHVAKWRPSRRYSPNNWPVEEAEVFLNAVERVYAWLDVNQC